MKENPIPNPFPLAMKPPEGKMTIITDKLIGSAVDMSRKSPRGRIILPLHKSDNNSVHRMLNAIQPYSYIQPHRHSDPPKDETIIVLRGLLAYIAFNDAGRVEEIIELSNQSNKIGVDTEPSIYHTFFALVQDTVVFEIKPGPYQKSSDRDFAKWAPSEKTEDSREYLESLYKLIDSTSSKGV